MFKTAFYCPQCGHKTLLKTKDYNISRHRIFACKYNALSHRESSDLKYGGPSSQAAVRERMEKRPPCGCVISHPERDAEISDFGTIIDKIARASRKGDDEFLGWLLEHDNTISKKGLRLLYKSEFSAVVYEKDTRKGYSDRINLYFVDEQNQDRVRQLPRSLTSEAATHIKFQGTPIPTIFANWINHLWAGGRHDLFPGEFNEEMEHKIVEWVTGLEKAFPDLLAEAERESNRWNLEEKEANNIIGNARGRIQLRHYDGHKRTISGTIIEDLTKDELAQIADILRPKKQVVGPAMNEQAAKV